MEPIIGNWRETLGIEGHEEIQLQKVVVEPHTRRLSARFVVEALPGEGIEDELRRALGRKFPDCTVRVRVACPSLAGDFRAEPAKYAQRLSEAVLRGAPGAAGFLRKAAWRMEDGRLLIETRGEAGASYLNERGCMEALTEAVKRLFGIDVAAHAVAGPDPQEEARDPREENEALKIIMLERERVLKEREKERKTRETVLHGAKISGKPLPIGELDDEAGTVTIEGQVLSCETRLLRGEKWVLLSVGITDHTGSIMAKAFLEPKEEKKAGKIEVGGGIRVKGDCRIDKYSGELAVNARDIMLIPLETREDDAPEKRVELHLHTQMSALDGVASVSTLMRRAAAWGQEAVAVTDHGVVQAFPEAFDTMDELEKAGTPIKLIPGVEGYLVDDANIIAREADGGPLDRTYVVADVETTGLNPRRDKLIEIAAVRIRGGRVIDEYTTLVNPSMPIPEKIVGITGITDEMVWEAPPPEQAIAGFAEFLAGDVCVAHNASFDSAFLWAAAREAGVALPQSYVDTLALARALLPSARNHKLNTLCKELGIPLKVHHRAIHDTRATAELFVKLLDRAREGGAKTLEDLNLLFGRSVAATGDSNHIVLLAANAAGLENLYRLVSAAHMSYYYRRPRLPRSLIQKHREGLIIGSACESGELFQAIRNKRPESEIDEIARFYDYLEIQPIGNNAFLVRDGEVADDEGLRDLNRAVVKAGERLGIPVCATCDVHFLDPEDAIYREILMSNKHFDDAQFQAPLYMRTTGEMLEEFAYLGREKACEVVVTNTRAIAARVERPRMFPKHPRDEVTFQPKLPDAERIVEEMAWEAARARYGDPLPEIVQKRIDKELKSIIGNGFATLYYSAQLLVRQSLADGYLVGSRGSVGSSFVATLIGVTEVNPLPPHYRCPACKASDFDVDAAAYLCGEDLPARDCPACGAAMAKEGYDIPFEVFLGFDGEKVPDIDLNFSSEYQAQAQAYVKTIFGENNVFKAGTIGTLAEKKAYGEVLRYLEETGKTVTSVEKDRLARGITGVRTSTGQHPGGMVVVPEEYDIHHFSPIQYPADKKESGVVTTHFDFGSLHDILVKLDILGHDDPTMIHMLERLTGVNVREIPLCDPKAMSLFTSTEALGVTPEQIGSNTGTLGIPEFGTSFVRGMLEETRPTTMDELLRISGLSHGTNVWLNNAQDLIRDGVATLRTCFCTRADILNTLIAHGVEPKTAFTIMEIVRKGRAKAALTPEMERAMKDAGVAQHYIDSCYKIEYLFPKAHAAAYVMMALRVAYFKVYHPMAYYAAYFTVRADEFDAATMLAPPDQLRAMMKELEEKEDDSARDERQATLLGSVLEMRERGYRFHPLDLYLSSAGEFLIEGDGIRPPLNRLPGVGQSAAEAIVAARDGGEFLSIEDMQLRSRVTKAVVEALRTQGCLRGMAETSQITLF